MWNHVAARAHTPALALRDSGGGDADASGADLLVTSTVGLEGTSAAFDTLRTPGGQGKIIVNP